MRGFMWILGLCLVAVGVLDPRIGMGGQALAGGESAKEAPSPTEPPIIRDCTHTVRIILSCTDEKSLKPCLLTFKLTPGEQKPSGCEPVLCDEAIVECTLDSGLYLGGKSAILCEGLMDYLLDHLCACLSEQGQGFARCRADEEFPFSLIIESREPFGCCLSSPEIVEEGYGILLGDCPLYNICDGLVGNETREVDGHESGLGIRCEPIPCEEIPPTATPTGTSTETRTETFTETPTATETVTETASPTATESASATPSETHTESPSPTPTDTLEPKIICSTTLTFTCPSDFPLEPGIFHLRLHEGELPIEVCEPILCATEKAVVDCELRCPDLSEEEKPTCLMYLERLVAPLLECLSAVDSVEARLVTLNDAVAVIHVDATFPCHWCLCGGDFDFPCENGLGLPIDVCVAHGPCGTITAAPPPIVTRRLDLNGDGVVNALDLIRLLAERGVKGNEMDSTLCFDFSQAWGGAAD